MDTSAIYNELNVLLERIRSLQDMIIADAVTNPGYIIKIETIDELYNRYHAKYFSSETPDMWHERFQDDKRKLQKIHLGRHSEANTDNAKLLIYTIIREVEGHLLRLNRKHQGFNKWVLDHFGFSYRTTKSYYSNPKLRLHPLYHPEAIKISSLLSLELEILKKYEEL
jgi:hypothetical protein